MSPDNNSIDFVQIFAHRYNRYGVWFMLLLSLAQHRITIEKFAKRCSVSSNFNLELDKVEVMPFIKKIENALHCVCV